MATNTSPRNSPSKLPPNRLSVTAFLTVESPTSTLKLMPKLTKSLPKSKINRIQHVRKSLYRITFDSEHDVNSALKNFNDHLIPGAVLEPPRRLIHSKPSSASFILRDVPSDILAEELQQHLNEINIQTSSTKRIISLNTGRPTPLVRCTSNDPQLVSDIINRGHVIIADLTLPVEAPRKRHLPLRCYRCQEYDHHQSSCSNVRRCNLCSANHERDQPCLSDARCANCDGPHAASSTSCPVWIAKLREKQENVRQKTPISPKITTRSTPPSPQVTRAEFDDLCKRLETQEEASMENTINIETNKESIKSLQETVSTSQVAIAAIVDQLKSMESSILDRIDAKFVAQEARSSSNKRSATSPPHDPRPNTTYASHRRSSSSHTPKRDHKANVNAVSTSR